LKRRIEPWAWSAQQFRAGFVMLISDTSLTTAHNLLDCVTA
jgi:hypothetical protein